MQVAGLTTVLVDQALQHSVVSFLEATIVVVASEERDIRIGG
jgi:hypothetical protein